MAGKKKSSPNEFSLVESKRGSCQWAKKLLQESNWVALHVDSIGLGKKAVIVRIAVLSPKGKVILNSLVRPPKKHKISDKELSVLSLDKHALNDAPKFATLLPELEQLFSEKRVLAFDCASQKKLFYRSAEQYSCVPPKIKWVDCLKLRYSKFLGVAGGAKRENEDVVLPTKGNAVDAVGKCSAILDLLKKMAGTRAPEPVAAKSIGSTKERRGVRLLLLSVLLVVAIFLAFEEGLQPFLERIFLLLENFVG